MSTVITLQEYIPLLLPLAQLPLEAARVLHQNYSKQVTVEAPSFLDNDHGGGHWRLTAQGWVGAIVLSPEITLVLTPRTPVHNLFRMIETVYNLESLQFLQGRYGVETLAEFYERLASFLAARILDRSRRGIYQAYIPNEASLPLVRGQIQVQRMLDRPWETRFPCRFEKHDVDIQDNQILVWTLKCLLDSGLCTEERSLPLVRRAYRALRQQVSVQPMAATVCLHRRYHRLNADYQLLHALCYFFLEEQGPAHVLGQHTTTPFLVDMARLYERFVAFWLQRRINPPYTIKAQERYLIGGAGGTHFTIDLVIYDSRSGRPRWVLDTKYKRPSARPGASDLAQIVAYAEAMGAKEAVLIYPSTLPQPFCAVIGDIRVRTLAFALDGDLDAAGKMLLDALIG
jgi:5-methylcytosine-specific restriction enzyme subunit McrC